ncbi:site-2 protease family protein [Kineosporia rhizophila]|uniref:M50 family metallopeptidase n=1 Tax=Kineosporia TaxID=49184 RepID=UPI001E4B02D4|nr:MULTISPECIES: site-2 protease family protein [Kineosporia]MCE0538902.1 site-2 protease family protein [Kineosporia rhizophila]GLY16237.1 zinc metalloprotease Rip1 [Kineosporia sp. NBRC 101677]
MSYTIGVVLFALGLLLSVCLHEAGHMLTAKLFGMRVTRYFAGFGPTVWSFRRGETEYGLKAVPLGGFVNIIGMAPGVEEPESEETEQQGRAFWQKPLWQRTLVLAAGSIVHLLIAILLLVPAFWLFGVPTLKELDQTPAVVGRVSDCVIPTYDVTEQGALRACTDADPRSPAAQAGLQRGDEITSIGGTAITSYAAFQKAVREQPVGEAVPLTYLRDGAEKTTEISLVSTQRPPLGAADASTLVATPTIGITNLTETYNVRSGFFDSVGQAFTTTGETIVRGYEAIAKLPGKISSLWNALLGAERSQDDPISVVGASRLGGEIVETSGIDGAATFLSILAGLNVFLGLFNLLPLPPLDGGHIAVGWYEAARRKLALRRQRPDPGPVDREKLIPVTLVIIAIFGAFTLLTVSVDVVNPIRLN